MLITLLIENELPNAVSKPKNTTPQEDKLSFLVTLQKSFMRLLGLLEKKPEEPPKSFNPYREPAVVEELDEEQPEYRRHHNWDENKVCKRCGIKWNEVVKKVGTAGITDEVLTTNRSIKEIIADKVNEDWCLNEVEKMIKDIIN